MESIELSLKSSKVESKRLAEKICKEYKYDLVIFIAKGSYTIGKELADFNNNTWKFNKRKTKKSAQYIA